jgi:hypothetical protein
MPPKGVDPGGLGQAVEDDRRTAPGKRIEQPLDLGRRAQAPGHEQEEHEVGQLGEQSLLPFKGPPQAQARADGRDRRQERYEAHRQGGPDKG